MIERMREAAGKGIFALQRCEVCGAAHYPPGAVCAACLSDRFAWEEAPERAGEVLARTVLHHSNDPWFRTTLPLAVGLVRLAVGPVVVCFLAGTCGPGEWVLVRASLDDATRAVLTATPA